MNKQILWKCCVGRIPLQAQWLGADVVTDDLGEFQGHCMNTAVIRGWSKMLPALSEFS